jgi:hypothetical protein
MNAILNYDLIMNSFNVIINNISHNKKLKKILETSLNLLSTGLIQASVKNFEKITSKLIKDEDESIVRSIALLRHSIDNQEMSVSVYNTIMSYYDQGDEDTEELESDADEEYLVSEDEEDLEIDDDEEELESDEEELESDEEEEIRDDIPDKLMDKIVTAYEELLEEEVVRDYLVVKRFRVKPDMDNIEICDVITGFYKVIKEVYENIADEDDEEELLEVVCRAEELANLFTMEDKDIKKNLL